MLINYVLLLQQVAESMLHEVAFCWLQLASLSDIDPNLGLEVLGMELGSRVADKRQTHFAGRFFGRTAGPGSASAELSRTKHQLQNASDWTD